MRSNYEEGTIDNTLNGILLSITVFRRRIGTKEDESLLS